MNAVEGRTQNPLAVQDGAIELLSALKVWNMPDARMYQRAHRGNRRFRTRFRTGVPPSWLVFHGDPVKNSQRAPTLKETGNRKIHVTATKLGFS